MWREEQDTSDRQQVRQTCFRLLLPVSLWGQLISPPLAFLLFMANKLHCSFSVACLLPTGVMYPDPHVQPSPDCRLYFTDAVFRMRVASVQLFLHITLGRIIIPCRRVLDLAGSTIYIEHEVCTIQETVTWNRGRIVKRFTLPSMISTSQCDLTKTESSALRAEGTTCLLTLAWTSAAARMEL
jgi:hypothetical protein